jgi:hypothetical protein
MRTRIILILALCFSLASPLSAASACPYHWLIAVMAAAQGVRQYAPEFRVPVLVVQGVAGAAFLTFAGRFVYRNLNPGVTHSENKSNG